MDYSDFSQTGLSNYYQLKNDPNTQVNEDASNPNISTSGQKISVTAAAAPAHVHNSILLTREKTLEDDDVTVIPPDDVIPEIPRREPSIRDRIFDEAHKGNWDFVADNVGFLEIRDFQDGKGSTLIHLAAQTKYSQKALEAMLAIPELANARDRNQQTPLMIAVMNIRSDAIIKVLLKAGADPDLVDSDNLSTRDYAERSEEPRLQKTFCQGPTENQPSHTTLRTHPNTDNRDIHTLARDQDIKALRLRIRSDVDVWQHDSQGRTIMHSAAEAGATLTLDWLINHYPDMCQATDNKGNWPIHSAFLKHQLEAARALWLYSPTPPANHDGMKLHNIVATMPSAIKGRFDYSFTTLIDDENEQLRQIYQQAKRGQWKQVMPQLPQLRHRLEQAMDGHQLIHIAAESPGSGDVLAYLCEQFPAMLLKTDINGQTALHIALINKRSARTFRTLLNGGANPLLNNHEGQSVLDLAINGPLSWLPSLLLEHLSKQTGGDGQSLLATLTEQTFREKSLPLLNCISQLKLTQQPVFALGRNLLHLAIEHSFSEAVEQLSQNRAELIEQSDINGDTPLHLAIQYARFGLTVAVYKEELMYQQNGDQETPIDLINQMPEDEKEQFLQLIPAHTKHTIKPFQPHSAKKEPYFSQWTMPKSSQTAVKIYQQALTAAKNKKRDELRQLYRDTPDTEFDQQFGNYSHYAIFAVMDDTNRLHTAMNMYPRTYKADLTLLEKDELDQYTCFDHLIQSGRILKPDSKLVISAHGPGIAGMNGRTFARMLDRWLTSTGCYKDMTPRITLRSCKTGQVKCDEDDSFAQQMLEELCALDRETKVTGCTEIVWAIEKGEDICGKAEAVEIDGRTIKKFTYWQGSGIWLDKKRQQQYGFQNISTKNRRTNLVKVYKLGKGGLVKADKFITEGAEGLHSIMLPVRPTIRKH
ncbi:ankyrin repeat domain-containing protein [Parendozoicomonas haliclonae]|uniref:Ankyrin repeats (3 copies) n=1 Tax=Parendozoicomonas haliclonae TaxID=1960125 RepID=A0A1X7AH21_9GAMM|nr:ankyrin repeat domain-containing protein [Parendozoicomonas haliclonae]SMA41600.1 Ankyrin repeats (3 copies) [Parendozoicomonas haliclonae]